jgi:hypothetical protein
MEKLDSVNVKIDALVSENNLLRDKIEDHEQRLVVSRNLQTCSRKC